MGTGRKYNSKPATRPKKTGAARRRREKVHRNRLEAMGVPASEIAHMTTKQVRDAVKLAAG